MRDFGRHIRSLRRVRGLTQEGLAERCGLAVDTIRRLEQGRFSPSLDTLTKLGSGLSLRLSTLFESFEVGMDGLEQSRAVTDLVLGCTAAEIRLLQAVITTLVSQLQIQLRRN